MKKNNNELTDWDYKFVTVLKYYNLALLMHNNNKSFGSKAGQGFV